jgi:hypothetical protein
VVSLGGGDSDIHEAQQELHVEQVGSAVIDYLPLEPVHGVRVGVIYDPDLIQLVLLRVNGAIEPYGVDVDRVGIDGGWHCVSDV